MPSADSTTRGDERFAKVAVSALGQSLNDRVDERFGRAASARCSSRRSPASTGPA